MIINKRKLHIAELKVWFDKNQIITNKQLVSFYQTFEPDVKETTVNWRIYNLVQMGILTRVGRGKYMLGNKYFYIPNIPNKIKTLNKKIKKQYPFTELCLWTTALYNEFMLHQPGKFFLIVEVEEDATEAIFYFMKKNKYSVFLEPDKNILNKYIPDEKETWIIKSFVSEAPTQNISGIPFPTIEKLLVDAFCDRLILNAQQGEERDRIFKGAYEKYAIKEDTMVRYANRRRKKEEFIDYLSQLSLLRQKI